jgi:hypothetical protein
MRRLTTRLLAALALSLAACGDGTFVVSFNSGVIAGAPRCAASGGQFDLRDEGGLVLVIITDGTDIFVAGRVGTCSDLLDGARVDVEGQQSSGEIIATSIRAS